MISGLVEHTIPKHLFMLPTPRIPFQTILPVLWFYYDISYTFPIYVLSYMETKLENGKEIFVFSGSNIGITGKIKEFSKNKVTIKFDKDEIIIDNSQVIVL